MFWHRSQPLTAYLHGELTAQEARRVEAHLSRCPRCRAELARLRLGAQSLSALPRPTAPDTLWARIESALPAENGTPLPRQRPVLAARFALVGTVGMALLTVLVWHPWRQTKPKPAWQVTRLTGTPVVAGARIAGTGRLAIGETLTTDSHSRARIRIADIGEMDVEPNTRIGLEQTQARQHRLNLARGTVRARVIAPPRLFLVDTPNATAVDLGCAYTLTVDAHNVTHLYVTSGQVALTLHGREVLVEKGGMCDSRAGQGPGTPYRDDASADFRAALTRLDFENGGDAALTELLTAIRLQDTYTLYHLVPRLGGAQKARVVDALLQWFPLPKGVTRAGLLRGDAKMLETWRVGMEFVWNSPL